MLLKSASLLSLLAFPRPILATIPSPFILASHAPPSTTRTFSTPGGSRSPSQRRSSSTTARASTARTRTTCSSTLTAMQSTSCTPAPASTREAWAWSSGSASPATAAPPGRHRSRCSRLRCYQTRATLRTSRTGVTRRSGSVLLVGWLCYLCLMARFGALAK